MDQGELSEQVKAVPPSQPDFVSTSDSTLSLLSHVNTAWSTAALPDQAHDGLQQSQYLVDVPVPDAAFVAVYRTEAASKLETRCVNMIC